MLKKGGETWRGCGGDIRDMSVVWGMLEGIGDNVGGVRRGKKTDRLSRIGFRGR